MLRTITRQMNTEVFYERLLPLFEHLTLTKADDMAYLSYDLVTLNQFLED